MYQSYQTLYETCQKQTSDDSATALVKFKSDLNIGASKCYTVAPLECFMGTATDTTVDGTYSYPLPYNCSKMHSVKVTISSVDYIVKEFPGDENQWLALRAGTSSSGESAYPSYYFIKKNTIEYYPTPSTSDYTITYRYKKTVKDMTAADYTTSTILTLANGGNAVTGNASVWTTAMVGRYFKINADGIWYEISARGGNTAITLAREYGGDAIAGGTEAYTIGEMSMLPEEYQELPIWYALWVYYMQKENVNLSAFYKGQFEQGLIGLRQYGSNLTTSGILSEDIILIDPNDNPILS